MSGLAEKLGIARQTINDMNLAEIGQLSKSGKNAARYVNDKCTKKPAK